jgi:hypothetical protein
MLVVTDPDDTGGPLDERLVAPGRSIELDAAASSGRCLDGVLLFRFSVDGGPELRAWSDNPVYVDAPGQDTEYLVEVRCSTDATCTGSALVSVEVDCPTAGGIGEPFPETILALESKTEFAWTSPLDFDLFSGELMDVAVYAGTLASGSGNSFTAEATPSSGQGFYHLVREPGEFCNDVGLWTSTGAGENPLRETSLP